MKLTDIISKTTKYKPKPEGDYVNFAVLLPLIETPRGLEILFEVRSMNLNKQPGEVCFPGGKVDKGESFLDAAIRETCEELNISEGNIEIIGQLDYLVTPYNLIIYPYIGVISGVDFHKIDPNPDEVDHLFLMDLDFALNTPEQLHIVDLNANPPGEFPYHMVLQGKKYKWRVGKYPVPFYKYNENIIWGFTARVLRNFVGVIDS
ncbi:CoA pyrophosphatase [Alkalicella caledoniensis]|uniref:CoA pyrophosphatase n=1 Tax=Alkalicella caledoniensis TaxID=2731377 RepID=A0A7G9WAA8_ALKCA|nr:CoA pyrophosphatase [Alkalicella caledoniensis]QNO15620.1 CoA pyrophosphatase [Alkalicella caledoniensis]